MSAQPIVWPSRLGTVEGVGLQPLVPAAPDIVRRAMLDALSDLTA